MCLRRQLGKYDIEVYLLILDCMSDYRFENPVKLFQTLKELKLPSGETLGNGLTCSSPVSLWDVVASYMVYYRFPLLWSQKDSLSRQQRLELHIRPYRGLAGRIKDYVTVHSRLCDSACGLWPANCSTVLFLGFHELFYKDVLQPVAEWLIKNSESHVVVLGQQSSCKREGEIINGQNFQSIWGHWDDKVKLRTQEMLGQLRTVQKSMLDTNQFDAMVRRANIDVDLSALQCEFKWFFWRECRRLIPQVAIAEHILTEHRPALIVSADDADQRCRIYSLLGQRLGIPSLVVQQGLTHRDYPEWKFFSMSEVAAIHCSAEGIYEPLFTDMLKVNVASVHAVLEHLRQHLGGRFIYASSAKVFGDPLPDIITKDTPKKNQCLYSITKNTAYHLIDYYRSQHNVTASVVYLFNHESELRPDHFFIPTIIEILVSAIEDPHHVSDINTLDFYCNWGSAKEYMQIIIDMLEKAPSEDFVLATDRCIYARDLVKSLFEDYGLKYQSHIKEKCHSNFETNPTYAVDLTKLKKYLGRTPQTTIYDVCKQIISLNYNL